jgi:hypothetical protein
MIPSAPLPANGIGGLVREFMEAEGLPLHPPLGNWIAAPDPDAATDWASANGGAYLAGGRGPGSSCAGVELVSDTTSFRTSRLAIEQFLHHLLRRFAGRPSISRAGTGSYPVGNRALYHLRFIEYPGSPRAIFGFYETVFAGEPAFYHARLTCHRSLILVLPAMSIGVYAGIPSSDGAPSHSGMTTGSSPRRRGLSECEPSIGGSQ